MDERLLEAGAAAAAAHLDFRSCSFFFLRTCATSQAMWMVSGEAACREAISKASLDRGQQHKFGPVSDSEFDICPSVCLKLCTAFVF